ncbi:nuclear transport factor 2 family protein [Streptomyces sp. NPDC026672]|uniref:nuclear transport factor 2 family protein n=1 Tax=unclassified Streptomyces TaxID=2593676 RepID=UPI0033C13414
MSTSTNSANADVVLDFFGHLSQGDAEAALALLDDDVRYWVAGKPEQFPLAGTYNKDEFIRMLGGVGQNMPNGVQVTVTSVTAQDERVVVEADTHGVSATGKTYDNNLIYAVEVRNGKIVKAREYLDTIHANDVLTGN